MRIAIFTDSYSPYVSGVTTAVLNQTMGLAKRGHHIMIFSPKYKNSDKIVSNHDPLPHFYDDEKGFSFNNNYK